MDMIFVGLQCQECQALSITAFLYQPFGLFLYLTGENAAAIFGNPYQVIRNRVVGISGFTHLQTTLIHASIILMNTVKIYQLNHLSPKQFQRCTAAQMEAAKVWNVCMETHKAARLGHRAWPGRDVLQKATKGGQFELHSQSVQMVVGVFLANIKTTKELRQTHPQMQMKYPWRTKRFYAVKWPAQAISKEHGRVVLPMGKGRPSLVLPIELPENSGACTLVWNNGYELHVGLEVPQAEEAPGRVQATVDLGEIVRREVA